MWYPREECVKFNLCRLNSSVPAKLLSVYVVMLLCDFWTILESCFRIRRFSFFPRVILSEYQFISVMLKKSFDYLLKKKKLDVLPTSCSCARSNDFVFVHPLMTCRSG